MKRPLPKLGRAASAALYGCLFLFCLPALWQQAWMNHQSGSIAMSAKLVPESKNQAQNLWNSEMACLEQVRVTLGANCTFQVTPNIVAEFNRLDCDPGQMKLIVADKDDKAIPNNLLTGIHAGQRLKYFLSHPVCNPSGCWGELIVEDKNMPRVDAYWFDPTPVICNRIDYILNNPLTIGWGDRTRSPRQPLPNTIIFNYSELADDVPNLGIVRFANCDPECPLTVKWSDKLEVYGCDSLAKNGLYARINRVWVATNCLGKSLSVTQKIDICRPAVADFEFNGPGSDDYDRVVTYQSCTPNKALIRRIDVTPFAYKTRAPGKDWAVNDTLFLDKEPCNYSMQIKDQEFQICEGRGVKIEREIYIFDWCKGGIVDTFHVLIKIGDFEGPSLTLPHHPIELSPGPMACEASLPVTAKGLKDVLGVEVSDNCRLANISVKVVSQDRYAKGFKIASKGEKEAWFEEIYPVVNGTLSGLHPGRHRVIIDAYDGCYNAVKDSFEITVVDKIAPVMVIDDQLNVSLSNTNARLKGYAKVCVEDIDEGSSDNCKLRWMKVRRNVPDDCVSSFIEKRYDSNDNGKLDPLPADGDWTKADGIDYDGDGQLASFGETFILKEGKLMTPLLNCVDFFCCDLDEKVVIELWGEDLSGNRNFAWSEILLEDKIAPLCSAPNDATIYCTDKCLSALNSRQAANQCFGDVNIITGNDCQNLDTTYQLIPKLKCGIGTIERIWTLTKQTSKGPLTTTCKQVITVLPVHEYNICFPKDVDQRTCSKPLIDTLIKDELACDLLSVNVTDKRYDASDNECFKIFRTYTVLNWCAYDDRCGDPMTAENIFVVDRGVFDNFGKNPIYMLVRDDDRDQDEEFYLSGNLIPNEELSADKKKGDYHISGDDDRNAAASGNGYRSTNYTAFKAGAKMPYCELAREYFHSFMYTQIIKVYDEERPIVNVPVLDKIPARPDDCLADAIINFTAKDNCTDKVELERAQLMIAPFQTTDAGSMILFSSPRWLVRESKGNAYQVTIRNLPQGKHDLIVVVRDECGNLSLPTRIPFEIRDLKAPAPICINGLSTELMSDGRGGGMMSVWANDFIASPIYDCNGQDRSKADPSGRPLVTKYSINRVGEAANPDQKGLNLTCADAGVTINVEIHAWDEVGNHDFCVTYLLVQDNREVCPAGASYTGEVTGLITTDDAEPLPGVNVQINGQSNQTIPSGAAGKFSFPKLQVGADYSIVPQLDKDHLNGVSTFDLVLVQKHILGTQLLTDPYQLIAADVNNSRAVSTLDLIQIRKLVLSIDARFSAVPSWKFVDAAYKFPNPSNPWSAEFPEVINVNDLPGKANADFIAIKMGDVNGSASTSSATASTLRSTQSLAIQAERLGQNKAAFGVGEAVSIALSAQDWQNIQGCQFTLAFDPQVLALGNIEYQGIKAENLGVFAAEGNITLSWHANSSKISAPADQNLLVLHFKTKAAGNVQEALRLNSRLTAAEAYTLHDEVIDVQLKWDQVPAKPGTALLLQNTPNPFKDQTTIAFSLPAASQATLSIRDVAGRLLWSQRNWYVKGDHQVQVQANLLKSAGVLYYTLEADHFTVTQKMIVLE